MNTCLICNKTFASALGLSGHKRMHGPSGGTITQTLCSCVITKIEMPVQYLTKYQNLLKPCKQCNKLFKPGTGKIFCGTSCSASYTNKQRGPRSEETKKKIKNSVSEYYKLKPKKTKIVSVKIKNTIHKIKTPKMPKVTGEFSKLFTCSCKHCKTKFVSRIKKQYCLKHRNLYSTSSKSGYKFTFNVYHYPDLFDLDLLNSTGWFSPGGHAGKWNIDGLSRDHKVSVTEAIANNYDPYYITHPLNCELMPHSQNNSKKTNSSITYSELKKLVDAYDSTK